MTPREANDHQLAEISALRERVALLVRENAELQGALTQAQAQVTEAVEQQTATSEILNVISRSPTDVRPVFDTVVEHASRLCSARDAQIFRREDAVLRLVAHHGPIPTGGVGEFTMPITRGTVNGRAVMEQRPVVVADLRAESMEFPEGSAISRNLGHRAVLSVPLMRDGVAIGALSVRRAEVVAFTDAQMALLQTFADQAVIAIENVRLFTELQAKNRALTQAHAQVTEALDQQTATSEVLRVISSSPIDVQPVFEAIAASAVRLCGAVNGAVFRFDGELIHIAAYHNISGVQLGPWQRQYPATLESGVVTARAILSRATVQVEDLTNDPWLAHTPVAQAGYRTVLSVPMMRDGLPIGAVNVTRMEVQPFSQNQVALLQTFADQAVIAIENVRLFTELQEKNSALTTAHSEVSEALERQTATSEILKVISRSQTDAHPVFNAIVNSALRLCNGLAGTFYRFDGELIHIVAQEGHTPGGREAFRSAYPMPLAGRSLVTRAMRERRIVHVRDCLNDPDVEPASRRRAEAGGFRSVLVVPMLKDGRAIGALGVNRREAEPFSAAQIELLKTFADQAIIAIENVRLFQELQERTSELQRSVGQLTALGEVGQAVSSSLDLETVLTTIVSRAVELSGLDGGVIFEYDESAEEFVQRATTQTGGLGAAGRAGVRKGEGVVGRTAVTLEPAQVADIRVAGAYESRLRETLVESGVRALLAVPIIREGRILGGLAVSRTRPGDFPDEIVELLRTFATQSALAIQNARLFREVELKGRQLASASQHKSEFLANMSHELRTPLNAIIGYSEMLQEEAQDRQQDALIPDLEKINAAAKHQLELINDILDLSKVEAGKMELELTNFHLPTAIDNALTLVRERAGRRGIALKATVDPRLGDVRADERKIKQVVLNLLSNAIKFTPEGGRIDVRALPVEGDVEVSVSDTGVGIAPEDQDAVFEEFRQVGASLSKQEGTGLGLTLCRKFVELHGGRIWVKSQVGAGSTFTFVIPERSRG